ncbi:MAG TPA: hypothetical protein VEZ14_13940 [Dehalococcoidia bacterium]|nr:hypothetical protein [Dehalococcoidia bacterium]
MVETWIVGLLVALVATPIGIASFVSARHAQATTATSGRASRLRPVRVNARRAPTAGERRDRQQGRRAA